jgi:DNA-binding PadR family transcriptional regulator
MTIAQLVEETGMAKTSVRQRLRQLVWEGWLSKEKRRNGRGRPADVFSLTERCRQRFAQDLGDLADALMPDVDAGHGASSRRFVIEREAGPVDAAPCQSTICDDPKEAIAASKSARDDDSASGSIPCAVRKAALEIRIDPCEGLGDDRNNTCGPGTFAVSQQMGIEIRDHKRDSNGGSRRTAKFTAGEDRAPLGGRDSHAPPVAASLFHAPNRCVMTIRRVEAERDLTDGPDAPAPGASSQAVHRGGDRGGNDVDRRGSRV